MHTSRSRIALVPVAALALLSACGKPAAPSWLQITKGEPCADPATCDEPAFYLDTANLSVRSGTPYVILQTRYRDGRLGSIRAEANCPRKKLEPTALKEALFQANGTLLENRMRAISAADENAVLAYACSKR
jgi:hypothetical protein